MRLCTLRLSSLFPLLAAEVAWNSRVPVNEASGPWRSVFKEQDPLAQGWVRSRDDPSVVRLRKQLEQENCMKSLKVFSTRDFNLSEALFHFRQDGFLILEGALDNLRLQALKNATDFIMRKVFQADPEGSYGGGAGKLPHRYSLGDVSATKSNFHLDAYCAVLEMSTTTPLLREIFASAEYLAAGCGGDVALAGAVEYQSLHPDAIWGVQQRPVQDLEVPPAVTINFVLDDLTALNGPMRVIPGSHRWHKRPPSLLEEVAWMKSNTLCPVKAGSAIFRDNRLWHGGTPNLAEQMRVLPNVEYFPPGGPASLGWLDRYTMPFEKWEKLSPFGQYVARGLVAPPGETLPGAGRYSPGAILDIMPFLR